MNGFEHYDIIRKPILTEKATLMREKDNHIAFEVDPRANKKMVAQAVEKIFNVKVTGVRIVNTSDKPKRFGKSAGVRNGYKKAIISLKEGEKIDIFERIK